MAYKYFNAEWIDIYNKTGGWSKVYGNKPVRAGGSSEYHSIIKVPQTAINAINDSSVAASLHMQFYVTTTAAEIDVGNHNENSARSTGASGLPQYAYNETINSISGGWNTYQMSNWFMPRLLNGSVEGVVLYSYQGAHYITARGLGETYAVRFRVTGQWEPDAVASTPRLSDETLNLNQSVTIYTDRNKTSLTHNITYQFGNKSGTIGTGITTSKNWIVPKNLAEEIKNATIGVGSITIKTYEGGTYIGSKSKNFTAYIPNTSEYNPTISNETYNIVGNGYDKTNNKILKDISILNITFSASSKYGATIKTYKINVDGRDYNSSNINTLTIRQSGIVKITYTAIDSRNRTITKELNITVVDYNKPNATNFTVKRTTGDIVNIISAGDWNTLSGTNSATAKIKYKESNNSYYTDLATLTIGVSGSFNIQQDFSGFSGLKSYDLILEITDEISEDVEQTSIGLERKTMGWGRYGIAVGKPYEDIATLEVGGDMLVEDELKTLKSVEANKGIGTTQHISVLGGGQFQTTGSPVGTMKITLPNSWTNTMLSFWVDVYNYITNTSFSVFIAGYTNIGSDWVSTTVRFIAGRSIKVQSIPVRFGHDGTKCCVYIGDTTQIWNYPKVIVRDLNVAHASSAYSYWNDGWNIDISDSILNSNVYYLTNAKTYPSLLNGWINYPSGGYETCNYYKDDNGIVHINGLVKSGTLAQPLFMLPDGYKPDKILIFNCYSSGDTIARIDVQGDGVVMIRTGNTSYISLSGISFKAER